MPTLVEPYFISLMVHTKDIYWSAGINWKIVRFAILLPFFTHQLKPMIFTAPIPGVGVMGRLFFAYSTCCDMFVCVGKNFTATGPSKIHVWVP